MVRRRWLLYRVGVVEPHPITNPQYITPHYTLHTHSYPRYTHTHTPHTHIPLLTTHAFLHSYHVTRQTIQWIHEPFHSTMFPSGGSIPSLHSPRVHPICPQAETPHVKKKMSAEATADTDRYQSLFKRQMHPVYQIIDNPWARIKVAPRLRSVWCTASSVLVSMRLGGCDSNTRRCSTWKIESQSIAVWKAE